MSPLDETLWGISSKPDHEKRANAFMGAGIKKLGEMVRKKQIYRFVPTQPSYFTRDERAERVCLIIKNSLLQQDKICSNSKKSRTGMHFW